MEMKGVTREEAVLYLLSLQDQIDLIVQHKKAEFDQLVANHQGDSFYIRYVSSGFQRDSFYRTNYYVSFYRVMICNIEIRTQKEALT